MPTVSTSVEVDATPDRVWALIDDFGRVPEWSVTHIAFPDGTPDATVGTVFREELRIIGRPGLVVWTVAEVDPPRRLRLEGAGPMGVTVGQSLTLAANGDGTTVTLATSFEGGPVVGPMGAAVAQAGERAVAASLRRLAALL